MGALPLPLPLPPPPPAHPGGWDPTREVPTGPSIGQVWADIQRAVGIGTDTVVEPSVQARDTDCAQTSNQNACTTCKLAQGYLTPANYTIPYRQFRDFDYQRRIANLYAAPEHFDYTYGGTALDRMLARVPKSMTEITITEWRHGAIRFDGFWRSRCTVVEAKGHYQQFFESDGELQGWARFRSPNVVESWMRQLSAQSLHVHRQGAPAKLEWHFLQRLCYEAASKAFGPLSSACRYSP
ncbi:Tox-REase-5 domain-containing protein [Stenotrophomonas sp. NPDC077461]|uniref:Tox-REase-5 domain-containing protein n=1 Tax=Stenotrophomonas sp. NPDC077461 TaxID=3414698 RepID=UPI00130F9088